MNSCPADSMGKALTHGVYGLLLLSSLSLVACSRLPYTTRIVHQDNEMTITLQQVPSGPIYTHPLQLTPEQLASILLGFSVKERRTVGASWYTGNPNPVPLFREEDISRLAGYLAQALYEVAPEQRVHFVLRRRGHNPVSEKDVVSGWLAVRQPICI